MGELDDRAKEPVSAALAGPYGHPFHPMLVTVPIGAWVCSAVFDVASRFAGTPGAFATGAEWLIGIGVLGAVAAAAVGLLDYFMIPSGTRARRTATLHMIANLAITLAFAVNLAWRIETESTATEAGPLVLSLLSLAALGFSGSLGGKLAYRYGVRVAAESTQATGFLLTADQAGAQTRSTTTHHHQ